MIHKLPVSASITINVSSTAGFLTAGYIKIDNEIFYNRSQHSNIINATSTIVAVGLAAKLGGSPFRDAITRRLALPTAPRGDYLTLEEIKSLAGER